MQQHAEWETVRGLLAGAGALALSLIMATREAAAETRCFADISGDGLVSSQDLALLLADWGRSGGAELASDLDGNGVVDAVDLTRLLESWNSCVQVPAWSVLIEARPDPSVVTDGALRNAILASAHAWRVRDRATGIEMLLVPKGSYTMGASPGDPLATIDEYPPHGITITRSFYLGRTEVTQREFASVTGYNPSYFNDGDGADGLHRPVDTVTRDEVDAFLALSGFRLPTEGEWEFACRAGTQTPIYSMEGQSLADIGWCAGNSESASHPVGTKSANPLGFHDMIGNVWEWCGDWYDGTYYSYSPALDPAGPALGMFRVLRGGSWGSNAQNARSSFRAALWSAAAFADVGFRVARTP